MSLVRAVRAALTAASPTPRVSQGVRPQGAPLPALTFIVVSREDEEHLRGDAGLQHARVQVDAWSTHSLEAEQMANEARLQMLNSTTFQAVTMAGFDEYEDDTKLYRVSRDFSVWLNT